MSPVLAVEGLTTEFDTRGGLARAVDGVSFALGAGEIIGLVGESGSGKSVTGFSLMGLIEPPVDPAEARAHFGGMPSPELTLRLEGDRAFVA